MVSTRKRKAASRHHHTQTMLCSQAMAKVAVSNSELPLPPQPGTMTIGDLTCTERAAATAALLVNVGINLHDLQKGNTGYTLSGLRIPGQARVCCVCACARACACACARASPHPPLRKTPDQATRTSSNSESVRANQRSTGQHGHRAGHGLRASVSATQCECDSRQLGIGFSPDVCRRDAGGRC